MPILPEVDIQYACQADGLPTAQAIENWVAAALERAGWTGQDAPQLSVRVVDLDEGAELNRAWRGKDGPTNVLSFPFDNPPGLDLPLLGDLVICAPLVRREAGEQDKPLEAHWAHLIVHGVLHLLGFDHLEAAEAERMESLESEILRGMGYADPYA
jgi:probable rRNA maturation factor